MSFSMWPPEVDSVLLLDGPGSGPMLEAAAAWDGIVGELSSAANTFSSVTTDLVGQAWQGSASASMTNVAAQYVDWLGGAAAQAELSATQARAAATAFEAALATIVNPGVIAANRSQLVSLAISNLFGQNAPAITAAEAAYEQMWAHDVAVMSGYHTSASATVAQLGQWEREFAKAIGNAFASVQQEIQQTPKPLTTGLPPLLNTLVDDIFGSPADPPFPATQGGTFTGTPSLITTLETDALYPLKNVLGLSGLETQVADPNSLLLKLFASDVPPISFFIGNSPPKILPLLLGETVQHTTYDGMSVVQIAADSPIRRLRGCPAPAAPSSFRRQSSTGSITRGWLTRPARPSKCRSTRCCSREVPPRRLYPKWPASSPWSWVNTGPPTSACRRLRGRQPRPGFPPIPGNRGAPGH